MEKFSAYKTRLKHKGLHKQIKDETISYNKGMKKLEDSLTYYDKKLRDNEVLVKLVSDLEKVYKRLKGYLNLAEKQTDDLSLDIKGKEEHRRALEDEWEAVKRRIKEVRGDDFRKTGSGTEDRCRIGFEEERGEKNVEEARREIGALRDVKDQLNDCR